MVQAFTILLLMDHSSNWRFSEYIMQEANTSILICLVNSYFIVNII